jgi:regulator of sigma E protease
LIATILAIAFLILVHELGHLGAAKLVGVNVPEFSLGFGKVLGRRRIGETDFCLRWFLLGGYVKTEDGFQDRPPLTRIFVALAGPASNLLLAFLIFSIVSFIGLPQLTATIGQVFPGRPAAKAGLLPGDKVTNVDGRPVVRWTEMTALVTEGKGRAVRLVVQRGHGTLIVSVIPETVAGKGMLGIKASGETVSTSYGLMASIEKGLQITGEQLKGSADLIMKLVGLAAVDVIGPVQIVKVGAEQAQIGWISLLFFVAILSANFVTFNLIPIPVLDGGLIVIALIELVTGRKINQKLQLLATKLSMAVVIGLMTFVFLSDLLKLSK